MFRNFHAQRLPTITQDNLQAMEEQYIAIKQLEVRLRKTSGCSRFAER